MEEEVQYLMWTPKRKHGLTSSKHAALVGDSWEEQAFAEDAAGPFGGFVWPPRSYSCTFCRREFRSAQALGGHMNIHRRERARLKQSDTSHPHHETISHQHSPNSSNLVHDQYPSMDYIPGSNYGVLTLAQHEISDRILPFSSPILEENQKDSSLIPFSWSNLEANNYSQSSSNLKDVEKNAFVGIGDMGDTTNNKRRRKDLTPIPLFPNQSSFDNCHLSKGMEISLISKEGLDLELRLGDTPKVK